MNRDGFGCEILSNCNSRASDCILHTFNGFGHVDTRLIIERCKHLNVRYTDAL